MKLNKKIIVPALSLLAGASLLGSVTGTIAWYQYSTRANVSYIGTSGGTIGNLQLRIKGASGEAGEWGTRLSIQDVENYLIAESVGQKIEPVTPGALAKNGSLSGKDFYVNPKLGMSSYDTWLKATKANYVKIPLQLRFIGKDEQDLTAEDVYLSKLLIQEDRLNDEVSEHGDLSEAIRVHFSAYEEGDEAHAVNHLVSKNGGTTQTHGRLKLGRGNDFDKAYADDDEFGFNGSTYDYVNYGGTSGEQKCYSAKVAQEQGYYYDEEAPASGWKSLALASGDVAPDDADGEDGDFYFDTVEQKLYQKDSGAWAEFVDVENGTEDPDLDTATAEDYFFNSASHKLFLKVEPHEETIDPALVSEVTNSLEIADLSADKKIGTTIVTKDPQTYLNVDVTIWVEGWQKFNKNGLMSSIWGSEYVGAKFDVGFQFAVQDKNV